MIVVDQVAEVLYGLGIRRVYGLPGEDHMALLDSFASAGLDYCAAFDESSAVIMAATDAQLTGLPGVAILSLAPGVSNGINGLLNTYLDQVPLLLISGQHPADRLPFVVRQGFDIERLVTPCTKWRARITAGMDVPSAVGTAIDMAMSGRPGPVYLEIPDAVATSYANTNVPLAPTARQTPPPVGAIGTRDGDPLAPSARSSGIVGANGMLGAAADRAAADPAAADSAAAGAVARLRSRWPVGAGVRSADGAAAVTGAADAAIPGAAAPGAAAPGAVTVGAGELAAVEEFAARLAAAERPVLIIGGRRRRVSPETADAFSRAYRVPVFTSSRQKGLLDSAAPYYAGTFLNGRLERGLLGSTTAVLMIDPESFDFYNKPWCFDAPAVAITDAAFTEWANPLDARLVADPEAVLRALITRAAKAPASQWDPADVLRYRKSVRESLLPPDAATFSVAHAVDAALAAWPRDGYLVADAGFSKPLVAMLSEPALPDHYLASNALSTMGFAIPAAVGARRAGARPVLAFLGDGSLLMRGTGLMVSADDGAPGVFVAIMDRSLTQIEVKQERRKLRPVGVSLPPVSCAKLAQAFGIDGADVGNAGDLTAAVAKGLEGDRPALIGAYVDPAPSRVLFDLLRG